MIIEKEKSKAKQETDYFFLDYKGRERGQDRVGEGERIRKK